MGKEKFYVTTAIDYTNGKPHIGHFFEKILADVIARYHVQSGFDTFFLTGSDEHGFKMQQSAEEKGVTPKELVDENVKYFQAMKEKLNLSYDYFIRTSDEKHKEIVQDIWKRCDKNGDIYKKKYKGLYCIGCEGFVNESDLVDGFCPIHGTDPQVVEEENWFFKLSNYKKEIKSIIENDSLKIYPKHRKKEILNMLDEIDDFSISRPMEKLSWGVEVPGDDSQTMYVWFDALSNYVTGVDFDLESDKFKKYWPADLHVIGKDIVRFHAIYWPAILMSANIEPPKGILVHGFITSGGKKMSKSIGNTIDTNEALSRYGLDALRYFLIREIPTTEDGDFTWERFDIRYKELANDLGNLVSRITNLAEKDDLSFENIKEESKKANIDKEFHSFMSEYKLDRALGLIRDKMGFYNTYLQKNEPWTIKDDDKKRIKIIQECLTAIKDIAEKLTPFLPETSEKILNILEEDKIRKAEPLFPKIEK